MRVHRSTFRRWLLSLLCVPMGGLAGAGDALAGNKAWIANSGLWTADASWSPFGRPAEHDNVTINNFPNGVVTYYQVDGGQYRNYGDLNVSRMELRVQQSLGASSLSLSGPSFSLASIENGANMYVGSATVGANALISITGNGSRFHATNITQTSGGIAGSTTVNGNYLLNGGTYSGALTNNGTFDYSAGSFLSGALINNGTFIHNGPAAGMQSVDVYSHGPMVFNTNATFLSLHNYASSTLPAGRSLTIKSFTNHRGGTFTQFGNMSTTILAIGGAAWEQHSGTLSITGSQFSQGELRIGLNSGPSTPIPGTFRIHGGNLRTDLIEVGSFVSAGTFEQSGGGVFVGSLTIGNRQGSVGSFNMSGGTFAANSVQLGRDGFASGTFNQSGGSFSVGSANLTGLVNISGGTFQSSFGGPAQPIANHGILRQSGGFSNLGAIDGAGKIEVSGSGSMTAGRIRQNAVHLAGNGKIVTSASAPVTHVVPLLSFDEPAGAVRGTWDMTDSALVVDYSTASPSAAIRRYLKSGYASGSWNGTGLSSSTAQASSNTTALGYAESSQIFGPSGGVFQGVLVDGTAVLVRYTRYGDANLDGVVNLADFNRLAANFGGTSAVWSMGDFNYDGLVNLADFNRLAANFGLTASGPEVTPEDWSALASAVPEPGCASAAVTCGLAALRRRRR